MPCSGRRCGRPADRPESANGNKVETGTISYRPDAGGTVGVDTIKAFTHIPNAEAVASRLSNVKEVYYRAHDSTRYRGFVGTLRVSAWLDRLVIEGSLPEFEGVTSLDSAATLRAVERAEEALGLSLRGADVWRLDVCGDVLTAGPPELYFPSLIRAPRYDRVPWNTTGVRFEQKWRHLVFYDRRARYDARGLPCPAAYGDAHVLRYEVQFRRRARRQLKVDALTVGDLLRPDFRRALVARWLAEYQRIEKRREWRRFSSVPALRRNMECLGILTFGACQLYEELDASHRAGRITPAQHRNLRRAIKASLNDSEHTDPDERVVELDRAVALMAVSSG